MNLGSIPLLSLKKIQYDSTGEINAQSQNYQSQLKSEMNNLFADIDKDTLKPDGNNDFNGMVVIDSIKYQW